jgi:hypothetical protein
MGWVLLDRDCVTMHSPQITRVRAVVAAVLCARCLCYVSWQKLQQPISRGAVSSVLPCPMQWQLTRRARAIVLQLLVR